MTNIKNVNHSKLLLLSSSRVGNTDYLAHAKTMIKNHLSNITEVLFIPYAGVSVSYDDYVNMVQNALTSINIKVTSIHQYDNALDAVKRAKAIMVGGGNTFHLLHQLYENNLITAIQDKVCQGTPYIGWSAGSNIAGASICTTNDMPIIEPKSFDALHLLPFQLNPHYTDHNPPGHNGETREQRLAEFMVLNPEVPVVGIVEGTGLLLDEGDLSLIGPSNGFVFKAGKKTTVDPSANLSQLLL